MTKKVTLTLSLFSVFLQSALMAQKQNVYFTGVGRALVTNETMTDQTNKVSKLKSSGGYTMFDLGIFGQASDVLRANVILRTRNEFGGFFSDGASLSFRQMQLEGLISKKVKYEIGDIYLTHTQYTLWNDENTIGYNKYESNLFTIRRNIVNYENFYVDNAWRMQGVNASSRINFSKGAESLGIRAYGGRTRQTNFTNIPDRYFFGGRLDLTQSKYLKIAGNIATVKDIAGTVKAADENYQNQVLTTDFNLASGESEKFKAGLTGELGASRLEAQKKADSSDYVVRDYFYDLGIKANYKPLDLNLGVSYRNVGFNFSSPMAQTRRTNAPDIVPGTFATLNDGTTARSISTFDSYSQERNMYNPGISFLLMKYYSQYDIVEPYGKATPNRKGITISADIKKPDELINGSVDLSFLSEIVAEGDALTFETKKFTKIRGGLVFNLHKLLNYEKTIALTAGLRTENASRVTSPVDLSSTLIDWGMDVEILKNLHVLGGIKLFKVRGHDFNVERNSINQIIKFNPTSFSQAQSIFAAGLRYDYDKVGYFSMHYNFVNYDNRLSLTNKYNISQLFLVFGLKF